MNEMAWILGPEKASAAAGAIWERFFSGDRADLDGEALRETVLYFLEPRHRRVGMTDFPRFPDEIEDIWQQVSGFPLSVATADDLAKQPIPPETTVIVPVGELVMKWAIRIENLLAERPAAREIN